MPGEEIERTHGLFVGVVLSKGAVTAVTYRRGVRRVDCCGAVTYDRPTHI